MIRAVFGGTFDPVHRGHRLVVQEILKRNLADCVHVVPAWRSPHKSGFSAQAEHRLAMVELVFGNVDRVTVETIEVDHGAPMFTANTLNELNRRFPEDLLRLVLGADQFAVFDSWHDPRGILELADLIVLSRGESKLEALCGAAGIPSSSCHLLADFDEPVSASDIRARIAASEDTGSLLDAAVAQYIHHHGLYQG